MSGRQIPINMEFNGHRFDGAVLTTLSDTQSECWSIDVPSVLWMFERIAAGDVDALTVREQLHRSTLWDSECCGDCDRASAHFDGALARQAELVRKWEEAQGALDAVEYPYILNKSKLHTLTCRHPAKPTPPWFPTNLHDFAMYFEARSWNLDAVFEEFDRDARRDARRYSISEVRAELVRRGLEVVQRKLCRVCKPSLPMLDPTDNSLRPACWQWPAGDEVLAQLRTEIVLSHSSNANVLPEHRESFAMLDQWHCGRCAVCGQVPPHRRGLVRDHDHASGMIRGLLCNRCNTNEGASTSPLFDNYRLRPPAIILNLEVLYLPAGFRPGTNHLASTIEKTAIV